MTDIKIEDQLIGPVTLIELKCHFCQAYLEEKVTTSYMTAGPHHLRNFRCPTCPKLVTYFYDKDLLNLKGRTIWTHIKEQDIVVFKSYIKNTSYIQMFHPTNQTLNNVTNIPFDANLTPDNVDSKVPIYITFS